MPEPSAAELDILKLFWRHGPMSAREARLHAGPDLGWTDSTTRTVLERMRAKGLLSRRSVHGLAVYAPAVNKLQVLGALVNRLRAALEIDGPLPAAAFTGSQILDDQEIIELQSVLNAEAEREEEAL
ncbi:MAG: CopY family transcriptional repressor [Caulobacteraceae bacterium]|nr:CopY family transcriptional repressor [Caulobacteraceae bacterium]